MGMQYIRYYYNVPAKRGGMVRFTDPSGKQWTGRIKSSFGARLRVAFHDAKRSTTILHPTWNIEYLDG